MLKLPAGRSSAYQKSRGFISGTIPFWDCSKGPTTNDRLLKLGASAEGIRGVAISAFDSESKETRLTYGMNGAAFALGRLDPDNWAPLDHGGIDLTWAIRLSDDHENPVTSLKHRSTIHVNQKKKMCWSYSQDLEWTIEIEEVGPPIPKGRDFNGAGFLSSLYGTIKKTTRTGKATVGATFRFPDFKPVETKSNQAAGKFRGTRCINLGQRGGFMTDGEHVCQIRQFMFMMPIGAPPKRRSPGQLQEDFEIERDARRRGAAGGSYSGTDYVPGGATYNPNHPQNKPLDTGLKVPGKNLSGIPNLQLNDAGGADKGCMVTRWQAAHRGDMIWDLGGYATNFAIVDVIEHESEDIFTGAFFLGRPSPRGPKYFPADDSSSDQPILEDPRSDRGLRPYVKIPRETGTPPPCQIKPDLDPTNGGYSTSGTIPPAAVSDAGEWRPPLPFNNNGMTMYEFTAGFISYVNERIPMPMSSPDAHLEILVPYLLPVNLAGGTQMNFRLFWKPSVTPGQEFPTTWSELTKSITPGDNPVSANQLKWLRFEIPSLGLGATGLGGGQIDVWFMRRSDDSATGKAFLMAGDLRYARAYTRTGKRLAFSGVV